MTLSCLLQLRTNVITTTADAVSFACLRHLDESAHAQMVSFWELMGKHAKVFYIKMKVNSILCGKAATFKE